MVLLRVQNLARASLLGLAFLAAVAADAAQSHVQTRVRGAQEFGIQNRSAHRHAVKRSAEKRVDACDLVPPTQQLFPAEGNFNHPRGMSAQRFAQVVKVAQTVYEPVFLERGEKLIIRALWQSPTPNASAYPAKDPIEVIMKRGDGPDAFDLRYRRVDIHGGLARHPEMTVDALLTVVCHEIGHHMGGLPVKAGSWGAANEGQSDYFATAKCMRRMLHEMDNVALVKRSPIDPLVRRACFAAHQKDDEEAALCMRSSMAGLQLAKVLGSFANQTNLGFDTPDRTTVARTDNAHPAAQCRLDTYFQGALCRVPFTTDMTDRSPLDGACVPERATGGNLGLRPGCWFNPKIYDRPELLLTRHQ